MAVVKHAVIRTDKMIGTKSDPHLYSVMFMKEDNAAEIDNGNLIQIGDLTDDREVFKAAAPKTGAKLGELAVTAGVVLFYDESKRHYEDEWVNEAGRPVRAYVLHENDIFSITAEAFNGTPEKGKFVDVENDKTTFKVSESATAATVGKIIEEETIGRYTYYAIRVIATTVGG